MYAVDCSMAFSCLHYSNQANSGPCSRGFIAIWFTVASATGFVAHAELPPAAAWQLLLAKQFTVYTYLPSGGLLSLKQASLKRN